MDWSDVLRGALSFFLIVTGLGLGFLMLQMAGVFTKVASALSRVTDEVVPILSKSQTTIDGVNQQLEHVDDIMESAVGATKTTEKAVGGVARAVSAPVRKLAALAAGLEQGVATFRARSAADAAGRDAATPTRTPGGAGGGAKHASPYPTAGPPDTNEGGGT